MTKYDWLAVMMVIAFIASAEAVFGTVAVAAFLLAVVLVLVGVVVLGQKDENGKWIL